jgi:putative DNA primase/helicase
VLAVDADTPEEAAQLEREYPELALAPRQDTPSGGAHFILRLPEGATPPKTRTRVQGRAVDVRGLGKAYLVAAPSKTRKGVYRWARPLVSPDALPVASSGLLTLVDPPKKAVAPAPTPRVPNVQEGDREHHYAQAALQAEYDAVVSAVPGSRNDILNTAAFNLGQLVGAGVLEQEEVEDALRSAAETCGLDPRETEATLKSGLEAGMEKPREIPEGRPPAPRTNTRATSTPTPPDLLQFNRTDYGAAERLHALYGHTFRHCGALGFLVWDGRRWVVDEGEAFMLRLAFKTTRELFSQASQLQDSDLRAGWVKHSLDRERSGALKAAVDLAKTIPGVAVEVAALDADPMLLNVENGTLDLRTGRLKPHDSRDLITKLAPVTFDPSAECPRWLEFQDTICAGKTDTIAFKQRAYGYSATGNTSEDCLFILHGLGANGKSTELSIISKLLGQYANIAQFDSFTVKKNEGVRDDLADLAGARCVSASEGESRRQLAEGLIKQLTGGDYIKARHLYGRQFQFKPAFKLWLATNHKPGIKGTDEGIWRRIKFIPYNVTIPPEKRDKRLREKLEGELSGILNWIVEGCRQWLEVGLMESPEVTAATKSYREESDVLAEFIGARCAIDPLYSESAAALYSAFEAWCRNNGEEPPSSTVFGKMLADRNYNSTVVRREGKPIRVRNGICLLEHSLAKGAEGGGVTG